MPHDKYDKQLRVGDHVLVRCVVTQVVPGTDYCNATLETIEPMFPAQHKTVIQVNTKQIELCQIVTFQVDGHEYHSNHRFLIGAVIMATHGQNPSYLLVDDDNKTIADCDEVEVSGKRFYTIPRATW